MKDELSVVWKHGRIYSIANVLNRLAGLVLLPVYLNVLTPTEFGVLALVTLTTDVLGVMLGLGLGRALVRFYAAATSDNERDELIVTSLLLLLGLSVIFTLLAYPLGQAASQLLFSSPEHARVFFVANLGTVFTVLFNFQLSCLVAQKASPAYLWSSVAKAIFMLGLNIGLVVWLDMGVLGVVLGTLISAAIVASVLLAKLLRGKRLKANRQAAIALMKFAAPLVPSVLIDTVAAALDKLALNRIDTAASVGSYATGARLASLLRLFVMQPFMQIWAVRKLESLSQNNTNDGENLGGIFDLFFIVLCAAGLFIALFAAEIVGLIAAPDYAAAATVVPVIILAEILLLFRNYFEIAVFHANATRYLPWIAGTILALAVPVYAVLTSAYGLLGAASAYLLVALVRVIFVGVLAVRLSEQVALSPHDWHKLLSRALTLVTAAAVFAAVTWIPLEAQSWQSFTVKLVAIPVFMAVLFYSPVLGNHGRAVVTDLLMALNPFRRAAKG